MIYLSSVKAIIFLTFPSFINDVSLLKCLLKACMTILPSLSLWLVTLFKISQYSLGFVCFMSLNSQGRDNEWYIVVFYFHGRAWMVHNDHSDHVNLPVSHSRGQLRR